MPHLTIPHYRTIPHYIHPMKNSVPRLVGSIKLQVSFAKEPYKRDDILQKSPTILSILLTVATPCMNRTRYCVHRIQMSYYNTLLPKSNGTTLYTVLLCLIMIPYYIHPMKDNAHRIIIQGIAISYCNTLCHTSDENQCTPYYDVLLRYLTTCTYIR